MNTIGKLSDQEIIGKILAKETALFELLIRRYNQDLYRIGKMYRFSHDDTQDLMQDAYIQAYTHLEQFQNRASFKTWLSKIMIHECYRKSRKLTSHPTESLDTNPLLLQKTGNTDTSKQVMGRELNAVIEKSLLRIPEDYRTVFVLREVNGFSVAQTAEILDITESNVKVRLNRAKTYLRTEIEKSYSKEEIFEFNLIYCDAMVDRVMSKISEFS